MAGERRTARVALLRRPAVRDADPDELAAFVGSRLAGYKKPRRIVVVPEVQRLNTGKADLVWARGHFGAEARDLPAISGGPRTLP
jgi:acyl-CoA synthetase (AMP-forming)/AMP-acid ligase II